MLSLVFVVIIHIRSYARLKVTLVLSNVIIPTPWYVEFPLILISCTIIAARRIYKNRKQCVSAVRYR